MDENEDCVNADAIDDKTDTDPSMKSLVVELKNCYLTSTIEDKQISSDEEDFETPSYQETRKNWGVKDDMDVNPPSTFILLEICSHFFYLEWSLKVLSRRWFLEELPMMNQENCNTKWKAHVALWKDPEHELEYIKHFVTLTSPIECTINGQFNMEVYDAKGQILRNCESSTVFTDECRSHDCLMILFSELYKSIDEEQIDLPHHVDKEVHFLLKLHFTITGCCASTPIL